MLVFPIQDQVKGLTHDLSNLEEELDAMKPAARDLKTVRTQIDDTGKLLKKVGFETLSAYLIIMIIIIYFDKKHNLC